MQRDFRNGYLAIDFPVQPFQSPVRLLGQALLVFFENLPFLAALTLLVHLPGKLACQFALSGLEATPLTAGLVEAIVDILLTALAAPALIFGLVAKFRGGRPALGESLRWARRLWRKSLWNELKMNITILLWAALFVIPGLFAMARMMFTDPIVAIEADREPDPLARSNELTRSRRGRILAVILPLIVLDFASYWVILRPLRGAAHSPALLALIDSLMAVVNQLGAVAALLMYLGTKPESATAEQPFEQAIRRS
jgi:hypothetical protein